ncbi:hypothetical protein ABIA32_001662 [Streptacidiphilus sp. MAP12-20]|uniref:hypothetical protein n=1 Tax=Streptacidiphilus sp. MAP12-20 TaxID=3156299 RepID=UPI0035114463
MERHHTSSGRPREDQPSEGQPGEGQPREDRLREALRDEVARHRPDREAMLARVTAGRASTRPVTRSRRPVARLAGFGVVSALLLGLSVAGTWAAVGRYVSPEPASRTAPGGSSELGSATSIPRPSASPIGPGAGPMGGRSAASSASTAPTSGPSGSGSPSPAPPASSAASSAAGTRVQQGFLWSDGSIGPGSTANWAQSDVTLKSSFTLTVLDVRLRVALTPGVGSTGIWSSVPAQDLVATVTRQGGDLVYEWTLKPGVTLAPGTCTFAGQYNHAAGGRDAGQDDYRATATGHGSQVLVYGNFYPVAAQ